VDVCLVPDSTGVDQGGLQAKNERGRGFFSLSLRDWWKGNQQILKSQRDKTQQLRGKKEENKKRTVHGCQATLGICLG